MKIGVFHSGIYWQDHGLRECGYAYDTLYIYNPSWHLFSYDVLIVPKGIHQGFLKERADQVYEFISNGGIVVAFGEQDGNWIRGAKWYPSQVGQQLTIVKPDHPVFAEISDAVINPWNKTVHGYFELGSVNYEPLIVVSGKPERVVGFVERIGPRGAFLATTMDPDYHTYAEVPFARTMLRNIIGWAVEQAGLSRAGAPPETITGGLAEFRSQVKIHLRPRKLTLLLLAALVAGLVVELLVHKGTGHPPKQTPHKPSGANADSTNRIQPEGQR